MPELENLKILFVINRISGNKDKTPLVDLITKKAASAGFIYRLYFTSGNNDRENISRQIEEFHPRVVGVAGGDGTCNLVAGILCGTEIKMGIIPMGSANGLATDINLPKDIEGAIDILIKGKSLSMDAIKLNDRFLCFHLADVGVNAKIVNRFMAEKKRSRRAYAKHLLRELFIFRIYKFEVGFDKNYLRKRAISITFANSSKFGTGAIINPEGKIDDGIFELCIILPFPWYYIIPITIKFFRGTLKQSKYVKILSCRTATIRSKKEVLLQVDGEIVEKTKQITAKIIPKALKIIVP